MWGYGYVGVGETGGQDACVSANVTFGTSGGR